MGWIIGSASQSELHIYPEHVRINFMQRNAAALSNSQLIQFFQGTGLMSGVQAADISARFQPLAFKKGAFFLKEGKVCERYLFLENGIMRAYVHDLDGEEVTTAFYTEGQMVFEVSSFFQRIPSQENIAAVADCDGWAISFDELNAFFHALPAFREAGRYILVRGFAAFKERMLSQITETAEARYEKLLHASPGLLQRVPVKYIASYLGVTDTSLSRIRAGLSRR